MELRRHLSPEQEKALRDEFWAYLRYDANKPELNCEDTFKAFVAGYLYHQNLNQARLANYRQMM